MSEIKFKGKCKESGKWVRGQLLYLDGSPFIVGGLVEANEEYTNLEWWNPVEEGTVSRCYESAAERTWDEEVEYIKKRKDWSGLLEDILDELIESSNTDGKSLEYTSHKAFRLREILGEEME